jgi:dTDP-N-acetylfucosamine:lipid II N-acetylfucosaminyltransferase
MNLHIAPDNSFINRFYDNLAEINALANNKIIIRTHAQSLKAVKRDIAFAKLYSKKFNLLVGDTESYEKVFIHYFTPLLYRWVARRKFKEVSWMVWGGDLYNLPETDLMCYEPLTLNKFVKKTTSLSKLLYHLKVMFTQSLFRKEAYAKLKNVLTWLPSEYEFACNHLPIGAQHQFFFYENPIEYGMLDATREKSASAIRKRPILIIGNSASATNNHIDTIQFLNENNLKADLMIPLSYGEKPYVEFLKKNIRYDGGNIDFIERYLPFNEYLNLISSADGLVMNTKRPQGYGNILMMLYLNKPVYFNPKHIALPDLSKNNIRWKTIEDLKNGTIGNVENKEGVLKLLSHERLLKEYARLFA